jgi:hypothetical protein
LENYNYPEDMFFAFQNGEKFKTAPIEVALQFSFEREVRECYRVNHNRLPFGCHAWETHDVLFWQPIFKEFGYDISNLVSVGNKDFTCRKEFADRKKEEAFWSKRGKLCLDNDSNRKLLIWGTGKYGKRMFDILKKSNVEISGFVDNDEEKCGKIKYGLEIYPPTIVGGDSQYFIIVAIAGNGGNAVKEQLLKMGKVYVTDYVLYNDAVCLRECVD